MTGGFISLRYFNADTTCITIDLASLSGIVLCCNVVMKCLRYDLKIKKHITAIIKGA